MSEIKSKRNVKIEIIRLIACMAVIWYHIRELPWKIDGELSETAVFFECVCTICVMTFFLITGFFIYNGKKSILGDWIALIKKFLSQVFVPFLFVVIFTIIFHEYLISTQSFLYCVSHISLIKIFQSVFECIRNYSTNNLPGSAAHLWYIFSYAFIIIVYPITRYIMMKLPKWVGYAAILLLTICMVVNDYFLFFGNPSYNLIFKIIHKPVYYSAWGHVLYNDIMKKYIDERQKDRSDKLFIINKPLFISSIIIYIITFILLFKTQVAYYLGTNGEYVYTSWLSIYSLVLTTCFILFVYNINLDRFLNEKIKSVIYYISSKTLGIYLIHYLIIVKLLSVGFQNIFTKNRPNIIYHLLYYIFYSLFIFIVTFLTLLIIEKIHKVVKSIVSKR